VFESLDFAKVTAIKEKDYEGSRVWDQEDLCH